MSCCWDCTIRQIRREVARHAYECPYHLDLEVAVAVVVMATVLQQLARRRTMLGLSKKREDAYLKALNEALDGGIDYVAKQKAERLINAAVGNPVEVNVEEDARLETGIKAIADEIDRLTLPA